MRQLDSLGQTSMQLDTESRRLSLGFYVLNEENDIAVIVHIISTILP